MRIIYLNPKSPFTKNIRSDTLWGLICWGIRNLFTQQEFNDFLASYSSEMDGMLKLSSAFPFFIIDGQKQLYFPRPQCRPFNWNEYLAGKGKKEKADVFSELKKFKKASLVKEDVFRKIISGELSETEFFGHPEYWNPKKIKGTGLITSDVMHNTINRLSGSTPENGGLYTKETSFANNYGLFFLIDGDDKFESMVLAAMRFYTHTGLGGDSSIGLNNFEISSEKYSFPVVESAECFVTLSLYNPKEDEISWIMQNKEYSWYDIEKRKGKMGSQYSRSEDFWKKSILMFKEGSVFKQMNKTIYGRNAVVKKANAQHDFDVLQYGLAFNLPIKVSE